MVAPDPPSLLIEPEPRQWRKWLEGRAPLTGDALASREALGLAADRPVVMTGHQAVFWHPGIMAKYLAAEAAARVLGASAAWVVVDQDTDVPWIVRCPEREAGGRLRAVHVDLRSSGTGGASPGGGEIPVCRLPAFVPGAADPGASFAVPSVREGLERIRVALGAHAGEANAARQMAGALAELMRGLVRPAPMVFATELSRAGVFASMVREMSRDPRACAEAYNGAVRAVPEAGLRPLVVSAVNERYELPLWRIGASAERTRVYAEELDAIPLRELAPRALMMTALLRAVACDLFIHGTGGGLYERATDAWMGAWMPGLRLAPVAVVTSTLRLALLDGEPPPGSDVSRARWRAHHARHDPALLGDVAGAARRGELVDAIRSARRNGREPRAAFRALHEFLAERRVIGTARLAALDREAEVMSERALSAEVANDRTWAFPFYPREAIEAMRAGVDRAFEGAR